MTYRVHHFSVGMTPDQVKLEQFLNSLDGEVVAIVPNLLPFPAVHVNFILVVEKVVRKPREPLEAEEEAS